MSVLKEVRLERLRQEAKWGEQNHKPERWMTILGEEYGETCRGILERDYVQARQEAIEVAAVAVAFVEYIDRAATWLDVGVS